jgi:5-formyltetrahydrofolate cyclo-ligase
MRELRRGLTDRPERSHAIWSKMQTLPAVRGATRVMVFTSIPSEPDTQPFIAWCVAEGKQIAVPEDDVDPTWPDVVVVPGLAFTTDGRRCGQGGGWYDRFLVGTRPECVAIGVCFAPQLLDDVPIDPHDVPVDLVITD